MFCNNCGTKLKDSACFCPECGTKQKPKSASVPAPEIAPKAEAAPKADAASKENTAPKTAESAEPPKQQYMRTNRKDYWIFTLFLCGAAALLTLLGVVGFVFSALLCLMQLGLNITRLHDIGKSGHYLWFALIPVFGWIYLLVLSCMPSDGDNMYGPREAA